MLALLLTSLISCKTFCGVSEPSKPILLDPPLYPSWITWESGEDGNLYLDQEEAKALGNYLIDIKAYIAVVEENVLGKERVEDE
jgi:hypothetical protein